MVLTGRLPLFKKKKKKKKRTKKKISQNAYSFPLSLAVIRCQLMPLVVPVVFIRCHSLSFVATRCITCETRNRTLKYKYVLM